METIRTNIPIDFHSHESSYIHLIFCFLNHILYFSTPCVHLSVHYGLSFKYTVPFTWALITDFHSLPHLLHLHQTFFLDFAFISSGFNGKFFSDHSEAILGCVVCKSLNPFRNIYPLQYGHFSPLERALTLVCHS